VSVALQDGENDVLELYVDDLSDFAKTVLQVFLSRIFRKAADVDFVGLHSRQTL
jgi:hypothetical protein